MGLEQLVTTLFIFQVLRKYGWIWGLDKPKKERPKLFIINLQWTPKDDQATLKINGEKNTTSALGLRSFIP